MHEYKEYPRWLYGAKGKAIIVQDREEHKAHADGVPGLEAPQWFFTPEEARAAFGEDIPAASSTDDTAKAALIARAEAVGLVVDARWSLKTLTVKVNEAEERATAPKEA